MSESSTDLADANQSILQAFKQLESHLSSEIVGQPLLVQRLLMALLTSGHILVEGAPGLAKTRAIKSLADGLDADFHRVQFTPDLLPADLTGSDVYRPEDGSFQFQQGPLFHNLLLADEINRAPAKVQSALLEAMAEGQITVGAHSYTLPDLFLVMATQNPIEQEGTYTLPEAQLDRFLFHVVVDYPDREASRDILRLVRQETQGKKSDGNSQIRLTQEQVFSARTEVNNLHLSDAVESYIVELIHASRSPGSYSNELAQWVRWGASPRGAIAIERGARAQAWLAGRDFVTPEDVQQVTPDALRHRVLLNYEAEADGISPEDFVQKLLQHVPAP